MTLPTVPSERSDPPGGLSIATATALLNSSMAKIARPGAQLALPTPQFPEPNLPVPPSLTPAHTSPPRSAIAVLPMRSADNSSDSSERSSSPSNEPVSSSSPWSKNEADLFIRSARLRGNDYAAILADLEAAGYKGRTANAMKSRYNKLRARGFFDDPAAAAQKASRRPSQADLSAQSSGSSSRPRPQTSTRDKATTASAQRQRNSKTRHKWTDEERRVLLRIGDKHFHTRNKVENVHQEWKKHFPASELGAGAVFVYYHSMRKKREEVQKEEDDDDEAEDGSEASSAGESSSSLSETEARSSAASSSAPPRRRASRRKEIPKRQPWQADEVKALEKVHRMFTCQKTKYSGPGPVYEAYCQFMPLTKRSQNAVGKKYRSLYAGLIRDTDSSGSSGGESSEDEEESDVEQHEGDSTALTVPDLEDFSQEGVSRRQTATKTPATAAASVPPHILTRPKASGQQDLPTATHALAAQSILPPLQSSKHTACHSFNQSFPPATHSSAPALNLLTTVLPDGVLFENAVGLGLAIYSPVSFKVFTPQQTAALAQAADHERPAFAFIVEEGGAVQSVVAPQGTTTSVRIVRDVEELGGGGGGEDSGDAGRMGVEAALCAVDGYKVTVVTWL